MGGTPSPMSKALPNIEKAEAGLGYALRVKFRGRGWKTIRLAGLIALQKAMAPIKDETEFRKVKVIDWGGGVGWPSGLDLGASTLWHMAEEQAPFTSADFLAWQKRVKLSNQEAADALGVSLPTIKNLRN